MKFPGKGNFFWIILGQKMDRKIIWAFDKSKVGKKKTMI